MESFSSVRGESTLSVNGRDIRVRASYDALSNIEEAVGGDLILFLKKMGVNQSIPVSTAAKIFYFLAKAGGNKMTVQECGQALLDNGFMTITMKLLVILGESMNAGSNEKLEGADPS